MLPNDANAHTSLQFVDKDPKLAEPVLKAVLKYWPVTNSQKEVLFLGELEEILEMTQVSLTVQACCLVSLTLIWNWYQDYMRIWRSALTI